MKNAPHPAQTLTALASILLISSCAAGPNQYERRSVNQLTHYGPEAPPKPTPLDGVPAKVIDPTKQTPVKQTSADVFNSPAPPVFEQPPVINQPQPRVRRRPPPPVVEIEPRIEQPDAQAAASPARERPAAGASLLEEQPSAPRDSLDHSFDDIRPPQSAESQAKADAAPKPPIKRLKPQPSPATQGYDVVLTYENAAALNDAEQAFDQSDIGHRFSVRKPGRYRIYLGRYTTAAQAKRRADSVAKRSGKTPTLEAFGGAKSVSQPAPSPSVESEPDEQAIKPSAAPAGPSAGDEGAKNDEAEQSEPAPPAKAPVKPAPLASLATQPASLPPATSQAKPAPSGFDVVATFNNEQEARRADAQLAASGIKQRFLVIKPNRYRIYVGRFTSEAVAQARVQTISGQTGIQVESQPVTGQ